ncbi:MAG: ATP-dependent helicase, partial [Treponema sp.]|nr:ATP-dependent helicase [Treponema sp.]
PPGFAAGGGARADFPAGGKGASVVRTAGRAGKSSSDGRWRTGDRVFHDDHGYGAVVAIQEEEDGPVVRVRFDTGAETRFLSRCQSRRYTKIGGDD